jgi:hypothetical protein
MFDFLITALPIFIVCALFVFVGLYSDGKWGLDDDFQSVTWTLAAIGVFAIIGSQVIEQVKGLTDKAFELAKLKKESASGENPGAW